MFYYSQETPYDKFACLTSVSKVDELIIFLIKT
jgi:hypothetical protein